ncbi:MAG: adenylate/guanylate cyclase domain-containing protein [Candidatus Omnitrophota bacterium]|jgi:adenylate cyclase|nr:MAG: adenylate/guanylate cyclase domain-containing protein [Candidatus Omnitrophota bacterium]
MKKFNPKTIQRLIGLSMGVYISFVSVHFLFDPRPNSHEPLFAVDAWCYDRLLRQRSIIYETMNESMPEIFILAFDEDSFSTLTTLEDPRLAQWPWSPRLFAQVVKRLRQFGVAVIGIDKLFVEPHLLNDAHDPFAHEEEFAQACREHGKVVLASKIEQIRPDESSVIQNLVEPLAILRESTRQGVISLPKDADDSIRRAFPFSRHQNRVLPAFATEITRLFLHLHEPDLQLGQDNVSMIGDLTVPLHHETFYISYDTTRIQRFPFYLFVDGLYETFSEPFFGAESNEGEMETFDVNRLKNSIVLMGAVTGELHDEFKTPIQIKPIPGVEIHANIVKTLLSAKILRHVDDRLQMGGTLLLAIVLCALCNFFSLRIGILSGIAGMVGWVGCSALLFLYGDWVIRAITPPVCVALATAASISYRYIFEEREKRYLKHLFSKATDAKLVDLLLENPDLVKLGGDKRRITVLFSDIRSFTPLSETMRPEELIVFLNQYFTAVTDVIFCNHGMIDKYIGDAVMAIFGAPVPCEDHAYQACKAAVEILRAQKKISQSFEAQGNAPFRIGIGVHTGPAVLGNLGSDKRSDYTCIGDTVNIASRIEGLNKDCQTEILISESTYREFAGWLEIREVGECAIRGRKGKVLLYELLNVQPRSDLAGSQE